MTWANNNDAVFEGTGATVTIDGPVSADSLTFNVNGYTLSGNSVLTLVSPATLTLGSGVSATNAAVIGGSAGLTINGTGSLTFSGSSANIYSGLTTIAGGTVNLNQSAEVNAIPGNLTIAPVSSGVTVNLGANDQVANTGVLAYASGGATPFSYFNMSGFNQTLAGLSDSLVRLVVQNEQTGSGQPAVTLTINNSTDYSFNGFLRTDVTPPTGSLGVTKQGTGRQTLAGSNITYNGPTTIQNGILELNSATAFGSVVNFPSGSTGVLQIAGTLTNTIAGLSSADAQDNSAIVQNNATNSSVLLINQATTNTFGGIIQNNPTANTLAIIKSGTGSLTLANANTYSGGTTLSAGQLNINYGGSGSANSAIGTGALTITGGKIDNTSGGAVTLTPTIAQNWNGDFTFLGLAGGTHDLNLGSGAVTLSANRQVTVNAGNLTVGGAIGGTNKLTKTGAGTLTLSGANTYSGGTAVSVGTLTLSGANSATNGGVSVANSGPNAVLNLPAGGSLTINDPSTSVSGLLVGSGGNANGAVNITGGSLSVTGTAFEQNLNFGVCANSSFTGYGYLGMTGGTLSTIHLYFGGIGTSGVTTNAGVGLISGGTATASGFLMLSRLTTQTSCLTIATNGTLNHFTSPGVAASQNITLGYGGGRSELNLAGGLLDSTGTSLSVRAGNAGTATAIVNLDSGTLVVNSFLNANSGSAYLNFNGGTLKASTNSTAFVPSTMTAVNVFSGGATIDSQNFNITNAAPLVAPGSNGVTAVAINVNGYGYIGAPYVSITGGTLAPGGCPATAIANMADDGTGNGTYQVASITVTCPGVYTAAPTGVTFTGGGPTTPAVAGPITTAGNPSGGLTKQGAGTLTLSGANTYTGNTTVNGGTLSLTQPTLSTNSTVTIASGAVLQLAFAAVQTNTVAALVLNGASQKAGVYDSSTPGGYLAGSTGKLLVAPLATINPKPPVLQVSYGAGSMTLGWPTNQGWILQTNNVGLAAPNAWGNYSPDGLVTVTNVTITVNPTQTNMFYRMVYP